MSKFTDDFLNHRFFSRWMKVGVVEWSGFTLLAIWFAAFLVFLNKTIFVPQFVFVIIWLCILILLFLALRKYLFDLLVLRSVSSKFLIIFSLLVIVGAAVKATSTGFDRHDEIYSWGMWGVQHMLGQSADFYYTGVAYPQLFSYEIASVFLAQGNHTAHFFAKIIMAIPSAIIVLVLGDAMMREGRSWINWRGIFFLFLFLIAFIGLMLWAYADPLASAYLLVSFALLFQFQKKPDESHLLIMSALCALAGSLTKQPGLIWCLFSLPIYIFYGAWKYKWRKKLVLPVVFILVFSLVWPLLIAPGFSGNDGVLDILRKNGGILASVGMSFQKYILKQVDVGLLLVVPLAAVFACRRGRVLWCLFVFPYLLIWFTLGSYEKRHGLHVVLISLMLLFYVFKQRDEKVFEGASESSCSRNRKWALFLSFFAFFAGIGLSYFLNEKKLEDGNKAIFVSQFGGGSEEVFDAMVASEGCIFVPSNYNYGALYARACLVRPDRFDWNASSKSLAMYLIGSNASYAISSGEWAYGPYSDEIDQLSLSCPSAVKKILQSSVYDFYKIYEVNQKRLQEDCAFSAV